MAAVPYSEWLDRGRAHQREGRSVDAMLCYRQAIRTAPKAVDAHFHLGEVLWQMGRLKEAIATWRHASAMEPHNLLLLLPLAESLLAIGDAVAARDVAARALALVPENAHAIALHAIARLTLGEGGDGDWPPQAIARVLESGASLLALPSVSIPLALALDASSAPAGRDALIMQLARLPAALGNTPALLLALALEHAATNGGDDAEALRCALLAVALERGYARDEHDALRRIALVATTLRADAAADLRAHYARLCAYACAGPFPLAWPQRCAGDRLRVVAVIGPLVDDVVADAVAALAAATADACDVTLAWIDAAAAPQIPSAARALRALVLPRSPDAAAAKELAALDADMLLDLAGIAASTGPLLAPRPAREIVTLAALVAPNGEPLIDRALPPGTDLASFLRASRAALAAARDAGVDAEAMGQTWERAVRAHQQADHASARTAYGNVLEVQPDFAPAHHLAAVLDRDAGDVAAARAGFAAALSIAPGYVDARVAAARLALDTGERDAAAALCAQGLARDPRQPDLIRTLGLTRLAQRDGAAAAELFARALAIDPTDSDTHYNHGVALQMGHDPAAAARAYQRALAFRPDLVAAEFNLGVIFQEQGNAAAAIAAYTAVERRDPGRVAAYKNLGEVLFTAGRIDEWLANFRRFEANCPDALGLAVQALEVLQHQGDFSRLEHYLEGLRRERYHAADETELCDNLEQLLYLLLFFDVEPGLVFRFAQTYDAMAERMHGARLPQAATRRPGRIRVGYLSADLRNHVMGKMVWQALEHHDRSRFAIHFYSLSRERDEWTERFAQIAERFDVVATLPEREAAMLIAADDLDILVDLSTHTNGARPGILALKPARVQLTHVASAGTVGLSAIDFKLTDNYADIPENQAEQIEALLPMAGCVYPFRRIAPAVTHPFHRDALGIAADAVLIGAFVTPMKLSRRCLGLWREVLERVPRARLVLSPTRAAFRGSYMRLTAAAGIAADRLYLLPQGRDDAENQARYELIDFVLDPVPYGGVNGTLEALDMGVPVVTLVGRRHAERTSYSILANLGVSQTVAQGGREYLDIAVRLATDAAFMRDVRATIRRGLASSTLVDAVGHTRSLEAAYCEALRQKAPAALREAEASAAHTVQP
jgi:protein O-GlcNAc transferase